MKLVMTLLVRDESDILAANLDYHLARGVDHIIATDNLSSDGATDILRSYETKGILTYIAEPDDSFQQPVWVSRMARMATREHGADWVINADVDEFWCPHRLDLKAMLALIPGRAEAASVPVLTFPPVAALGYFADVMTVRQVLSRNDLGMLTQDKVCHRAIVGVSSAPGNHDALLNGRRLQSERAAISILHYSLRTYPQFSAKIARAGAALLRQNPHPLASTARWMMLYEMLQAGTLEAHFNAQVLDEAAIEAGVASGTLVRDERVKATR